MVLKCDKNLKKVLSQLIKEEEFDEKTSTSIGDIAYHRGLKHAYQRVLSFTQSELEWKKFTG